jgi:hypothetical protein
MTILLERPRQSPSILHRCSPAVKTAGPRSCCLVWFPIAGESPFILLTKCTVSEVR